MSSVDFPVLHFFLLPLVCFITACKVASCRVVTKNYFISGNPVSLHHRKWKESVFSKDFFELKTQPKGYDSSL